MLCRLPGAEFVEIRQNREQGLCCGGGGDLEIADAGLAGSLTIRTVDAFAATGADVVVTACQQCNRSLQTAREQRGASLKILDIAELVQQTAGD